MSRFRRSTLAAALWLSVLPLAASEPENAPPPEESAVAAATTWLSEVDAGAYGESWDHAAELFRRAVTRENWQQALNGVRKPLGAVISRELQSATYATELPGAPDGEYVVIQFETSFAEKKNAVETITPMKDPDGAWRVSGYYIQ
jgi:hypothetical protein